jgi:beta-N-acetylhexosaminidase
VGLEAGSVIGERAYSDDPQQVASFATASVRAYRRERVFSAAKHFPGLGSASQSTEEGPANVGLSLADLRSRDLIPFMAAIRAQVPGIVVGHGLYLADDSVTPASLSRRFVTDLLRGELRFRGVAITDDLANPPITSQSSIPEAAVRAIKAGADMVFISGSPADQRAAYRAVLRAVREGDVPPTRVNEAVLRILAAKRAAGVTR